MAAQGLVIGSSDSFIGESWIGDGEAASGGGSTIVESTGASAGVATTNGIAAAFVTSVGASDGIATVSGQSAIVLASVAASAGIATVTGIATNLAATVAAANGVAAVTGLSQSIAGSVANANGIAAVNGITAYIVVSVGSSSGAANVNGILGATSGAVGQTSGLATVFGEGENGAAPFVPPVLPYTANSGSIDESFVVDYGQPEPKKPKFKLKKLKNYENIAKNSQIRTIIIEAVAHCAGSSLVIGKCTVFLTYKGQLIRTPVKARSVLMRSSNF